MYISAKLLFNIPFKKWDTKIIGISIDISIKMVNFKSNLYWYTTLIKQ